MVLNGQTSSWADVNTGVPQGSILGPLLFLIYINDLAVGLPSNAKLFADDTSLFSVVHNANTTAKALNNDLVKISRWAYQWKMSFNPDPGKQAQEVIFSRKTKKEYHPPLAINNNNVSETNSQKHLGVVLDNRLSFEDHFKMIINKVNKTIGLFHKLQNILPRSLLFTIYKSFIRPHIDYGDITYEQAYNTSFHQKLERLQYNACLAITGAIRGTSREKLYEELGLDNIPFFKTRHSFFKNSFFPSTISEWNNLDHNIRNSSSFNIFRRSILKFIRPSANSFFNCHNPKGIKFITRLRLGLSHFREHKFKHSFQDSLNPFCSCGLDIESTGHYLLHCPKYITERRTLLSTIENIDNNLLDVCEPVLIKTLLFGSNLFDSNANTNVLNATIEYVLSTKRFEEPLFQ